MESPRPLANVVVHSPEELRCGDLLFRRLHSCDHLILHHYGCYAGQDFYGNHLVFEHRKGSSPRLVTFQAFALKYEVLHEPVLDIDREAARMRMLDLISEQIGYQELLFNCEHAARYVAEGKSYSWQSRSGFVFLAACALLVVLARH